MLPLLWSYQPQLLICQNKRAPIFHKLLSALFQLTKPRRAYPFPPRETTITYIAVYLFNFKRPFALRFGAERFRSDRGGEDRLDAQNEHSQIGRYGHEIIGIPITTFTGAQYRFPFR